MTGAPSIGGAGLGMGMGFRNRIINGAMVIDQRNAGASVTITANAYTLDRWALFATQASKFTVQQNAGSVTPPAGFTNYLGVTVGASANVTVGAGDYFVLNQPIEGFNTADFGFGTASAATVTLSFWVRSSLTGTFGGSFYNDTATRVYSFTYTISAANTWEQKTITVAGDTSGTWVGATNGRGLIVLFTLGAGATFGQGTPNTWSSTKWAGPTGATNLITTNSATFYITGVQLEKGSTATSFDYRPFGTELALCQRYYQKVIGGVATSGGFTTSIFVTVQLPVQMRSAPTSVSQTGVINITSPGISDYSQSATGLTFNDATVNGCFVSILNFSGLTTQRSYPIRTNGGSLIFDTEL